MQSSAIRPAFSDPPREAQAVFRNVMEAMARPGRILPLAAGFMPPAPLNPPAAAILIALADFGTPIWLDGPLARQEDVVEFLRFHTGAKRAATAETADFALIADPVNAPPLAAFAQGVPDYPDRSATVIFQVEALRADGWLLTGPGINGQAGFSASPLPAGFEEQLRDNRAQMPLGVDVIFAAFSAIAALPRSTRFVEAR